MNKYEQLIEFIINEDEDKARALFHEIVVEKSRDIYESLIDEQDLEEVGGNEVDSLVDEITADETGGVVEAEDEFGGDDMAAGEESEFDFDASGELDSHEEEHAGEESRIDDLEDALEELKAEFDKLLAQEEGSHEGEEAGEEMSAEEPEVEGMYEAEECADEEKGSGSASGSGAKSGSGSGRKMTEAESIREYVEKVAAPAKAEGADNKSSVVAGKNDMGGTAGNIAKGGEESGMKAPKAKDIASGNVNVPGGKAALAKGPTATKAEQGAVNDKSPLAK